MKLLFDTLSSQYLSTTGCPKRKVYKFEKAKLGKETR